MVLLTLILVLVNMRSNDICPLFVGVTVPRKHARVVLVLVDVFLQLLNNSVFCAIWNRSRMVSSSLVVCRFPAFASSALPHSQYPSALQYVPPYTGIVSQRCTALTDVSANASSREDCTVLQMVLLYTGTVSQCCHGLHGCKRCTRVLICGRVVSQDVAVLQDVPLYTGAVSQYSASRSELPRASRILQKMPPHKLRGFKW